MSAGIDTNDHAILICTKCSGQAAASQLRTQLADQLPSGFAIRVVDCMAGCDHPPTLAFQAPGKATYLFGEIKGPDNIAAIVEFSHTYQQSDNGWTCASERPTDLYEKTLARIPAINSADRP